MSGPPTSPISDFDHYLFGIPPPPPPPPSRDSREPTSPTVTRSATRQKVTNHIVTQMTAHPTVTMTGLARPCDPFSLSEDYASAAERWQEWKLEFECFVGAAGLTDEKQKIHSLINQAGKEVRAVWRSLKGRQSFNTLDDLIAALDGYFAPKTNVHFARFEFSRCKQEAGETTDAFLTRLKTKAETCNFTVEYTCGCNPATSGTKSYEEEELVNMVISKCNNAELRKKFLALEGTVTLDRVLKVARAEEASSRQAMEMSEPKADQVNKLSKKKGFSDLGAKGNKGANAQNVSKCYCCGQEGHRPYEKDVCPAANQTCGYCRKKGHFQVVCRIKKNAETTQKSVKCTTLKGKAEDSDSEDSITYQLKSLQVNKVSAKKERVYVDVKLNGEPFKMQLDCGSDITVISEELANEIPGLKRQPCKHKLKAMDSVINVLYIVQGQGESPVGRGD